VCIFGRSNTLLLCISLLCIYLLYHTDPLTHRLDHFLKFSELSGEVGISRIPSKNADRKLLIFLENTLLLSQFHKQSLLHIPLFLVKWELVVFFQRTLIEKLPIFLVYTLLLFCSHKHSFTPYPTLSPYSHRQNYRQRNELILVGLGNLWFLQVNPGWAG
jgi:hypothetical protein